MMTPKERYKKIQLITDPLKYKKEMEYYDYIMNHIANVKSAFQTISREDIWVKICKYLGIVIPVKSEDDMQFAGILDSVKQAVEVHDRSKFSDEEWEPYRKNFHYISEEEKEMNEADFQKAWEHHYTTNMHHHKWWALTGKQDKMPWVYVIEMCLDWIAMSMKTDGETAWDWYKKQDDIVLGEQQRFFVENFLKIYYHIDDGMVI